MVRRFFVVAGLLLMTSVSRASVFDTWIASHTSTADTYVVVYASPAVLNAVCLNRNSGAGGQFNVYNSSSGTFGVNIGTIALIDVSSNSKSGACSVYNTYMSQGIVYLSSGTPAADMNIMFSRASH